MASVVGQQWSWGWGRQRPLARAVEAVKGVWVLFWEQFTGEALKIWLRTALLNVSCSCMFLLVCLSALESELPKDQDFVLFGAQQNPQGPEHQRCPRRAWWLEDYFSPNHNSTCLVGRYFLTGTGLIPMFTDSSVIAPSQELYQLTLCDLASAQLAPFSPVALNT